MRILLLIYITILSFSSCSNGQNTSLTAEKIWENNLKTIGEKEVVMNIKSFLVTFKADLKNGQTIRQFKTKYPDKLYQEILYPDNTKVIYVINGDQSIIKSSNGIKTLSNQEISRFRMITLIFPEFHYQRLGYKIELLDEVIVDKKTFYNLRIETPIETINKLIDKENFKTFRIIGKEHSTESFEMIEVNSIKLVKSFKSIYGNDTIFFNSSDH